MTKNAEFYNPCPPEGIFQDGSVLRMDFCGGGSYTSTDSHFN